eukprot:CAMPEP_0194047704 /NCGR_PEP_ID=MMETSP0009_2-20130614/25199_1 /TAXON_ID=210454 /ORGANISM="Grammatophora oceanica, Strain CCMP 410" /LENGTH=202 /DNA_ID=CAMNT_0038693387 /DNA_START=100 /DNA_END=705 /DNA_ORIENTATION=+
MKYLALLLATCSLLCVSAFGVSAVPKSTAATNKPAFTGALTRQQPNNCDSATESTLFRRESVRGGAVPGWAAYNRALDTNPITAKACTSLVGWALGDLLAQIFITGISQTNPFDVKRFLTLSFFGFAYHGPSGHYFYNWLDSKIEGTGLKSVMSKVAIDQIFWCPIFMTVFFTYLGLVNGDSLSTISSKIKNDLLGACQGSW